MDKERYFVWKNYEALEELVESPPSTATIVDKSITANGTYRASSDEADGYNPVVVNVANSYSAGDEGKVVDNGALVSQTAYPTTVTTNDTYDTTLNNSITVNVANSYTAGDEGKVVDNGALVAQTAMASNITVNDTYDTTLYNSVTVTVPNTYTAGDEGKVVDNGELVSQTAYPTTVTTNGTITTTTNNSVTIDVQPLVEKDVNFYDYDGTIVASYTAQEFLALTALPANPTHTGLTAQGWNWSLSDAQTYVTTYTKLNIGQMYVTSDGKTRVYITLQDGATAPYVRLYLNADTELDIDWGDNSTHDTLTSTSVGFQAIQHTYTTAGDYVIAITVVSGSFEIRGGGSSATDSTSNLLLKNTASTASPSNHRAYLGAIKKVELGNSVNLGASSFGNCTSLTSVSIPNTVTSVGQYMVSCSSLTYMTIPTGVTEISSSALGTGSSSAYIVLRTVSIPNTVTIIRSNAFQNCSSLTSITIPTSVTSIGNNAFDGCRSLASLTIPGSTTTTPSYMNRNCASLTSLTYTNGITTLGSGQTYGCPITTITIPSSVTSIDSSAFGQTSALAKIIINKAEDSIEGSPWGATNAQVIWTG